MSDRLARIKRFLRYWLDGSDVPHGPYYPTVREAWRESASTNEWWARRW